MRRGPKLKSKEEKIAQGTYQACRDKPKHLVINAPPPLMPSYLPTEAQDVWHEEIDRVVLAGTNELDSSIFARYCVIEAQFRSIILSGGHVQAAQSTELRRLAELLGIGGAPSRHDRGTPAVEPTNEFAALAKR